jgi:hypothetical protein
VGFDENYGCHRDDRGEDDELLRHGGRLTKQLLYR